MADSNMKHALQWEAEKWYVANKAKNKASGDERKAQKELDVLMAQANDGEECSFQHSFQYDGRDVMIEVSYTQTLRDTVDIRALHEKIGLEELLNTVTATRTSVEKNAGKNIANIVTKSTVGDWKAKVREKK